MALSGLSVHGGRTPGWASCLAACSAVSGSSLTSLAVSSSEMGMTAPKCLAGACLRWCVLPKCWVRSSQTTVCTCPHASQVRGQLENSVCDAFSRYCNWPTDTPQGRQSVGLQFIEEPDLPRAPPGVMAEPQRQAGFWLQEEPSQALHHYTSFYK